MRPYDRAGRTRHARQVGVCGPAPAITFISAADIPHIRQRAIIIWIIQAWYGKDQLGLTSETLGPANIHVSEPAASDRRRETAYRLADPDMQLGRLAVGRLRRFATPLGRGRRDGLRRLLLVRGPIAALPVGTFRVLLCLPLLLLSPLLEVVVGSSWQEETSEAAVLPRESQGGVRALVAVPTSRTKRTTSHNIATPLDPWW